MKSGTDNLMKFHRLQRMLGETKRATVGILELLWMATGKNAPQGDIGKLTDDEIAICCDWSADAGKLISALVECRWLDRCEVNRLVVHDWAEHAPRWIKGNLASQSKPFAVAVPPPQPPAVPPCKTPLRPSPPNQALPSHTKKESLPAEPAPIPQGLLELIDRWNALDSAIVKVGNRAKRNPPARAVVTGWNRAMKTSELREPLGEMGAVFDAIERSKFCHGQSWFRLPWLFGTNKVGEFNLVKLMEGGHEQLARRNGHAVDRAPKYERVAR